MEFVGHWLVEHWGSWLLHRVSMPAWNGTKKKGLHTRSMYTYFPSKTWLAIKAGQWIHPYLPHTKILLTFREENSCDHWEICSAAMIGVFWGSLLAMVLAICLGWYSERTKRSCTGWELLLYCRRTKRSCTGWELLLYCRSTRAIIVGT